MRRFVALVLMVLFVGSNLHVSSASEIVWIEPPTTLEELEYRTPNIVRGRVADDARTILDPLDGAPRSQAVSLELLEVIQGGLGICRTGHTRRTIIIIEPYIPLGSHMPSLAHQEYFFFLSDPFVRRHDSHPEEYDGARFVMWGANGRFLVPRSREAMQYYSAQDLSITEVGLTEEYIRLWEEVIDAYMIWPDIPPRRSIRQLLIEFASRFVQS